MRYTARNGTAFARSVGMRYSIPLAARSRDVSQYNMHRSITPQPDSKSSRPTTPPDSDDAAAVEFELQLLKNGETETRLEYLARVYNVTRVR